MTDSAIMTGTILVVDDEPDVEILLKQRFRHAIRSGEFRFLFAANGAEALATLARQPDVAVVLADINMPLLDGLALLGHMPEVAPAARTVIVSAYGDMTNIRTAMNRGAYDFLVKPVDMGELEATVRRALALPREARGGTRLAAVLDACPIGAAVADDGGVLRHINQHAAAMLGLAPEALAGVPASRLFDRPVALDEAAARGGMAVALAGRGVAPVPGRLWVSDAEWAGRPARILWLLP